MKIIPFVSVLEFFFEKDSDKLIILNRTTLPYSKKFLAKIRSAYFPNTDSFPSRFSVKDRSTFLILNLDGSIFSFPLSEIYIHKEGVVGFTTSYDYKLHVYLSHQTVYYFGVRTGEMRIGPLTVGIILISEGEKKEELINTGIGMLSLYSPDDYDTLM